jgi:HAD superfamily hydrolase (TIGR01490 family)
LELPILYTRYRLGLLDIRHVNRPVEPLAGLTSERLRELGEESFEQGTREDIYADMARIIAALRERERPVVLASTSFRFLLEPLARHLGATGLVCSELEIDAGVSTGHILGPPCYGEEKAKRVVEYCGCVGCDVTGASFYTDSHHDLPLLEQVASPVAVNPDFRLSYHARRYGWPVIRLS